MSLKKIIPIIVILGLVLAAPLTAQARPDRNRSSLALGPVQVFDHNGDGVKDDAQISATLTLVSDKPQTDAQVTVMYFLTYVPDGTYSGPYSSGMCWVFTKTYNGVSSSPGGVENQILFNVDALPYPGWYRIRATAVYSGQHVVSNVVTFDPPGGGPGPIGC